MSKFRRIFNIIVGILMIAVAFVLVIFPELGYVIIVVSLMATLIIRGIRSLVYYFTMARHTTGGIIIFYQGAFLLDAGVFAFTLDNVPPVYTMIYLIICMLAAGGIDVLRANEARRMQSGRWRLQMIYGAGNVILGIVCVFFLSSITILTVVYAIGLVHSAVCRIINGFRKTVLVYIE